MVERDKDARGDATGVRVVPDTSYIMYTTTLHIFKGGRRPPPERVPVYAEGAPSSFEDLRMPPLL